MRSQRNFPNGGPSEHVSLDASGEGIWKRQAWSNPTPTLASILKQVEVAHKHRLYIERANNEITANWTGGRSVPQIMWDVEVLRQAT